MAPRWWPSDGSAAPWIAAGATAAVFCWWTAPSAAFFDSGELAATAIELGVPHPTGFPLFNLAGHLGALLPLSGGAHRVNVVGAVCASLAAASLLWLGLRRVGGGFGVAGVVALSLLSLALVAMPSVARHARAAEIYPLVWLHAVACAGVLLGPSHRRLLGMSALLGAGISLHAESALIAGVFGLFALIEAIAERRQARAYIAAAVAFALAAVAILYLPLAASRPAAFSWGDVQTPQRAWEHLTASSIRAAFAEEMGGGPEIAVGMLARQLSADLGGALWIAGAGAIVLGLWARRTMAIVLLLALVDAGYSVLINPMGLRDEQCGQLTCLCLGALLVVALWAALQRFAPSRWLRDAAFAGVGLVLVAAGLGRLHAERPNEMLRGASALPEAVLSTVPPGGLAAVSSDHLASLCTHAQVAEGARPDALCMPIAFTRQPVMLRVLARRGGDGFLGAAAQLQRDDSARSMAAAMGRWLRPALAAGSVPWELGSAAEDAQVRSHYVAGFPAGRVAQEKPAIARQTEAIEASLAAARSFCDGPGRCLPGSDDAGLVGRWAALLAAHQLRGGGSSAATLLRYANRQAPGDRTVINNTAVALLAQGEPSEALAACERGLALHPEHAVLHRTATRAALAAGDLSGARLHAQRYLDTPHGRRSGQRWLRALLTIATEQERAALTPLIATP